MFNLTKDQLANWAWTEYEKQSALRLQEIHFIIQEGFFINQPVSVSIPTDIYRYFSSTYFGVMAGYDFESKCFKICDNYLNGNFEFSYCKKDQINPCPEESIHYIPYEVRENNFNLVTELKINLE